MAAQPDHSNFFLKNWTVILSLLGLVYAIGKYSAGFDTLKEKQASGFNTLSVKQTEQDARYQRQFELINKLQERVVALEMKEAYRRGIEDAGKKQTNTTISLTP